MSDDPEKCPQYGHETERFYGGERGEGGSYQRCLSDDCDWNEETIERQNYSLAISLLQRRDIIERRCADADYDREILAAARKAGVSLIPLFALASKDEE